MRRFLLVPLILPLVLLLGLPGRAAAQNTSYVATNGIDAPGRGSLALPLATITYALDIATDGSTILVRPGEYLGRIRIRGNFAQGVTVRSEVPYRARLRHNATVITIYQTTEDIAGITLEGFDIAHTGVGSGALVVQIQDDIGTDTSRITLRDNILHDSFNNDILKINNGASDILVSGNLFYNQQGSDEHIDANSVDNVTIEDNVFCNDYAASGRPQPNDTASYIVVKDSNAADDEYLGARNVTIRRNVFCNWRGSTGSNFVLLGEDGTANFEAFNVLVENNLLLGNSANTMRAAFGCKGCRDATFRANTVQGDLPSLAYALRINREASNPMAQNVRFFNNIWSDPTGTMDDFSDTDPADIQSFTLSNNLYWNGGMALPEDAVELINPSDDALAVTGDPGFATLAGLVVPTWNATTGTFAGGALSIREAFLALVQAHGQPAAGSGGLDRALPAEMPTTDIRGVTRDATPDIGAFERPPGLFADGFEG